MGEHKRPETGKAGVDSGFSAEEKGKLREVALQAIRCRCLGRDMPEITVEEPRLKADGAAFVCIHKGRELRGCMGMLEARTPLWQTVKRMAVEAAFADPRFCALSSEELDGIDIEISVLTPMQRISGVSEIEIGRHGLFIRKGYRSGLLLPQVATEHNLDAEGFLRSTCHKAGLPEEAWKDGAVEIYVFSADVF
ncbi:MAG: AmmeMemoRadiSam system protein A [Syntrophobacteraceae bacterium]|nr:AmmeMemoRadiSam system protein A [Syntrophobacteraceae bacterium]